VDAFKKPEPQSHTAYLGFCGGEIYSNEVKAVASGGAGERVSDYRDVT
jgi:hypothetical protein